MEQSGVAEFSMFVAQLYRTETWGPWWDVLERAGTIVLQCNGRSVSASLSCLGSGQHCVVMHLAADPGMYIALKLVSSKCPIQDVEFVETELMIEASIMAEIERMCWNRDCKQHISLLFCSGRVMPLRVPMLVMESYAGYRDLSHLFTNGYKFETDAQWLETMRQALFQIIFTLAELQSVFPGFRHNDLKDNNVLVNVLHDKERVGATYILPGHPVRYIIDHVLTDVKLIDFATAHADAPRMSNSNVATNVYVDFDITDMACPLYDLHFLMECFLIRMGHMRVTAGLAEVLLFIKDVIPDKYFHAPLLNRGSRLSLEAQHAINVDPDVRFKTPADVLQHPFFACFALPCASTPWSVYDDPLQPDFEMDEAAVMIEQLEGSEMAQAECSPVPAVEAVM